MRLEDADKRELLRIARSSIGNSLRGVSEGGHPTSSEAIREPSGVFVTLRSNGELRGCIGYVEPRLPLNQAVREVAEKAAFEDPRFVPVTSGELDGIEIEISVLSPLSRVEDVQTIEAGKHGLVIDAGFTRGLLLPHVATEYGWTREEFLNHTALKAGLAQEAWKTDRVTIYSFTTETFSESELPQLN